MTKNDIFTHFVRKMTYFTSFDGHHASRCSYLAEHFCILYVLASIQAIICVKRVETSKVMMRFMFLSKNDMSQKTPLKPMF